MGVLAVTADGGLQHITRDGEVLQLQQDGAEQRGPATWLRVVVGQPACRIQQVRREAVAEHAHDELEQGLRIAAVRSQVRQQYVAPPGLTTDGQRATELIVDPYRRFTGRRA